MQALEDSGTQSQVSARLEEMSRKAMTDAKEKGALLDQVHAHAYVCMYIVYIMYVCVCYILIMCICMYVYMYI
jgi:hypothetical protein